MLGKSHLKFPVKVSLGTPAMCPRPNQRENENQSRASFADRVYTLLAFQLSISPNPIYWTRGNQ